MSYPIGLKDVEYLRFKNGVYFHSEILRSDVFQVIECDMNDKLMKVRTYRPKKNQWEEMDLKELIKGDIIDLSDNGERWEGDSLQHKPFGYGCIYNSENQIIYKGFIFEEKKVCYGSEFFGDVGIVEYEGCYYKNMRFGKGRLYNKKNELIYDGEWFNNQPIDNRSVIAGYKFKAYNIHFGLEELIFEAGYDGVTDYFILNGFHHLKRLVIGKKCFGNCNESRYCNYWDTIRFDEQDRLLWIEDKRGDDDNDNGNYSYSHNWNENYSDEGYYYNHYYNEENDDEENDDEENDDEENENEENDDEENDDMECEDTHSESENEESDEDEMSDCSFDEYTLFNDHEDDFEELNCGYIRIKNCMQLEEITLDEFSCGFFRRRFVLRSI